MSWKSLVTASLLCVVASPAFAAPGLTVTSGGLNAQGNWLWNVAATSSQASTPLAVEAGFKVTAGGELLNATRWQPFGVDGNDATDADDNFDLLNPGNAIYAWQTGTLLDAASNNKPTGIQTQCPLGTCSTESRTAASSVAGPGNEVFAALGSVDFATAGAHNFIQIVTKGPTSTSLTSTIQVLGKYGAGTNQGLVAEANTPTTALNYVLPAGSATRTVKAGDATLNGTTDVGDLAVLAANYNQSGKIWSTADFTGNGSTDVGDLAVLAANYNQSGGVSTPYNGVGAGSGSGSVVPEPASMALIGLGLLAGLGVIRRR
jgi:hypothetical protein